MGEEIWKDIPNYEGYYQVSNLGRVKSLDIVKKFKDNRKPFIKKGIIRKTHQNPSSGYWVLRLSINGLRTTHYVHRLMIHAFYGIDCTDGKVVDHINNIRSDNRLCNLQVITQRENTSKRVNKSQKLSAFVGVSKSKKNWKASIFINKERISLGIYKSEIKASDIYKIATINHNLFDGNKKDFTEKILNLYKLQNNE